MKNIIFIIFILLFFPLVAFSESLPPNIVPPQKDSYAENYGYFYLINNTGRDLEYRYEHIYYDFNVDEAVFYSGKIQKNSYTVIPNYFDKNVGKNKDFCFLYFEINNTNLSGAINGGINKKDKSIHLFINQSRSITIPFLKYRFFILDIKNKRINPLCIPVEKINDIINNFKYQKSNMKKTVG